MSETEEKSSNESIETKTKNESEEIIQRLNEHVYILWLDPLLQFRSDSNPSTLLTIQKDLHQHEQSLLANEGVVQIKEYALDAYECRCHEEDLLVNEAQINDEQYIFNYQLKF